MNILKHFTLPSSILHSVTQHIVPCVFNFKTMGINLKKISIISIKHLYNVKKDMYSKF